MHTPVNTRVIIRLSTVSAEAVCNALNSVGSGGITVLAKTPKDCNTTYINVSKYYTLDSPCDRLDYVRNFILHNNRYITPEYVSVIIYHSP